MGLPCACIVPALTRRHPFVILRTVQTRPRKYPAAATHPGTDGEVWGIIIFDSQRLAFESDPLTLEMPLDQLTIEQQETGRVAFFTPAASDWLVSTADESVLKDYFLQHHIRLRQRVLELSQRREGTRTLKLAAACLAVFAAVFLIIWQLSTWTVGFLTWATPVAWETRLADKTILEMKGKLRPVEDPARQALLDGLTKRLADALADRRYDFQVTIIDDPLPNAASLPGGRIFVHRGLFLVSEEPEELAGVLAHEMAHVTRRDGLRRLISAAGPYYVLRLFITDRDQFLTVVSAGAQLLTVQAYSRQVECETDEAGWRLLLAANIDPRGLARFLQKEEISAGAFTALLDAHSFGPLRSHPEAQERIARLNRLWEQSPRKSGFVDLGTEGAAP